MIKVNGGVISSEVARVACPYLSTCTSVIPSDVGLWVAIGFVWLLFELISPGLFFCLSLAIGSMSAAASAWYGVDLFMQAAVFTGASMISFFILYFLLGAKAHKGEHYKSGIDALPGKKGLVTKKISPHYIGQVDIKGEIWSAQAFHNEVIEEGASIEVIRVEGVRLIVRIENKQ